MMTVTNDPVREYAQLLLKHHEHDPRGEKDIPELDAVCEEMDGPWKRMDGRQRRRMKGLSEDLYALADGRRAIPMSAEDRVKWAARGTEAVQAGDLDVYLDNLRQPPPEGFTVEIIPAFQAWAWDRLGLPEVALLFYLEAGKVLPMSKIHAMDCLRRLGRIQEARELAEQLLTLPQSLSGQIYQTSSTLIQLALERPSGVRSQILEMAVEPLRHVIEAEHKIPLASRQDHDLERVSACALTSALINLNRLVEAREVCDEAFKNYPDDPDLLLCRGAVNLSTNPNAAEADFMRAVDVLVQYSLPYAVLALFRVKQGKYADALALASQAMLFPDPPDEIRSLLFELRGISLAELRQPRERIEEEFARARTLSPTSASRIEDNRELAMKSLESPPAAKPRVEWNLPGPEPVLSQLRTRLIREIDASPFRGESYSELLAASTY